MEQYSLQKDIDEMMDKLVLTMEDCQEAITYAFKLACIEAVRDARSNDTYKDQSGNLRNSIGYVMYQNGQRIASMFPNNTPPREDTGADLDGASRGEALADSIAEGHPEGIVVVLVAGMDYAYFVERNGYDVITSASNALPYSIIEKIKKAIQEIANRRR